jgi:hypothetical protein
MHFVYFYLFRVTLALVVIVACGAWWLTPTPANVASNSAPAVAWSLPTLAPKQVEKNVSLINAANFWGAPTLEAAQATLNAPEWRFAGITRNGVEKMVLISIDNQTPQLLKKGELLPGGSRIVEISDDHLCLMVNGKKRRLDIF